MFFLTIDFPTTNSKLTCPLNKLFPLNWNQPSCCLWGVCSVFHCVHRCTVTYLSAICSSPVINSFVSHHSGPILSCTLFLYIHKGSCYFNIICSFTINFLHLLFSWSTTSFCLDLWLTMDNSRICRRTHFCWALRNVIRYLPLLMQWLLFYFPSLR